MAGLNRNASELDWLTAAIMGEGAGETRQGMAGIADVLLNRAQGYNSPASAYGTSDIGYAPNTIAGQYSALSGLAKVPQFSSYVKEQAVKEGGGSAAAYNNFVNALNRGATAFSGQGLDRYNQARDVARSFLDSSRADYNRYRGISGGSDYFQTQNVRNDKTNSGNWDSQILGTQAFFRNKGEGGFDPYTDAGANANIAGIPNPPTRPSTDDLGAYAGLTTNLPPTRPSDAELSRYAGSIDQGGALDRFSDGLTSGLQDAAYQLADQFASVTGRLPSLDELQGRLADLGAGASTLYGQLRDIAGSQEAANYGQRIGVDPSQYAPQGEAPAFTGQGAGFYTNPFASVNDFIGNLTGDGGLRNGTFADGSAFQSGNLVNAAYHQFLGRDPTAEERGAWSDQIGQPGTNLSSVLAQIAGSQEAGNLRTSLMGSDASTGGAASYEPYLTRTSWGTDASTAAGVPTYTPNTGTAVGTDASRGGSYSYDPYLGYTSRGTDASTGGAGSYGSYVDPYGFGSKIGTAGNLGGATPDASPSYGPITTAAFDPSLPDFSPLSGVSTSGLGMNGATDAANSGRYGASGVGTLTPDGGTSYPPITSAGVNTSLPAFTPLQGVDTSRYGMGGQTDASNSGRYGDASVPTLTPDAPPSFPPITTDPVANLPATSDPLTTPANVGPMAFGHTDVSSGLGGILNGLYVGALGRQADQSGLDAYGDAIRSGALSLNGVYDTLRNSTEGQGYTPPSVLNFDPTWGLYAYALGRAPDAQGYTDTANALQNGGSYYDILSNMLTSKEGLEYAGSQGHDGNYVADQLAGLSQARDTLGSGALNLDGILGSSVNNQLGMAAYGPAWLSPFEVQSRSAGRARLMANDAANVANNSFLTGSNAFNTLQTNNPSLASVPGPIHGDATGAGAALNNISLQLANERAAIAQLPVAQTATPIQSNFYGAHPTANSKSLFGTGLPPGAGFL